MKYTIRKQTKSWAVYQLFSVGCKHIKTFDTFGEAMGLIFKLAGKVDLNDRVDIEFIRN